MEVVPPDLAASHTLISSLQGQVLYASPIDRSSVPDEGDLTPRRPLFISLLHLMKQPEVDFLNTKLTIWTLPLTLKP